MKAIMTGDPFVVLSAMLAILAFCCVFAGCFYQLGGIRALLLDPRLYVLLAVFVGVVFKLGWLAVFELPPLAMDSYFSSDKAVVKATIYIGCSIGIFFLAFGIMPNVQIRQPVLSAQLIPSLRLVYIFMFFISVTAFYVMWESLGWSTLWSNVSAKRFNDMDGGASRMQSSVYWLYQLSGLLKYPLYLFAAYVFSSARRVRFFDYALIFVGIGFLVLQSITLSQRAHLLMLIVDMFLIYLLFSSAAQVRVSWRKVIPVAISVVFLFMYVTVSRSDHAAEKTFAEHFVYSKYFLDLGKTAMIIEYSDSVGKGDSCALFGWVFLFTPSIGVEFKECFLQLGKFVGSEVYGLEVSGVPPGFLGEMYLYFGFLGGVFGALALALFMWSCKVIMLTEDFIFRVIYAILITRFLFLLFNNGVGQFLLRIFFEGMLVSLFFMVVCFFKQIISLKRSVKAGVDE